MAEAQIIAPDLLGDQSNVQFTMPQEPATEAASCRCYRCGQIGHFRYDKITRKLCSNPPLLQPRGPQIICCQQRRFGKRHRRGQRVGRSHYSQSLTTVALRSAIRVLTATVARLQQEVAALRAQPPATAFAAPPPAPALVPIVVAPAPQPNTRAPLPHARVAQQPPQRAAPLPQPRTVLRAAAHAFYPPPSPPQPAPPQPAQPQQSAQPQPRPSAQRPPSAVSVRLAEITAQQQQQRKDQIAAARLRCEVATKAAASGNAPDSACCFVDENGQTIFVIPILWSPAPDQERSVITRAHDLGATIIDHHGARFYDDHGTVALPSQW